MRSLKFKIIPFLFIFFAPLFLSGQVNDCVGAVVICSDGPVVFTPNGPGIDDFADLDNDPGCLEFNENQSAWYYFEFDGSMAANSVIEFTIDPNGGMVEDYDFAIYGPNIDCDNLGSPVRCSWAASNCTFCPQTGLGNGAVDNSEGNDGDGFVAPMTVQPGEGYYLVVDNFLGTSNGFQLSWGGSAASFLNCNSPCNVIPNAGIDVTVCEDVPPFLLSGSASGTSGSESYSWNGTDGGTAFLSDPNSATPTVMLPAGYSGVIIYTLTVTDGGCSKTDDVIITLNASPAPTILGASEICTGQSTTLDAGGGYSSYQWSDGSPGQTLDVTVGGTYSVTVTDANSCMGTASVVVNEFPTPNPNISGNFIICAGETATLDAGPGYVSYLWSDNTTGQIFITNFPGTYSVVVVDGNGCTATATANVVFNPGSIPNISGNLTICPGNSTTLDGGPGFVSYQWSDNSTTQQITVTTPGTYTLTVTDGNGCQGIDAVTVEGLQAPTPIITGEITICEGDTTTLDAGAGYFFYQWSDGSSGQFIIASAEGIFGLTVTDSNGCEGTDSVSVTEVLELAPFITGNLSFCSGDSTVLDAGVGYATYLWSDNSIFQQLTVDTSGDYSVTVTNANGCSGTTSITVLENPLPGVEISGNPAFCAGDTITLDAGPGFVSYQWSDTSINQSLEVFVQDTYSVSVIDVNGCSNFTSVDVIELPEPSPAINGDSDFCPGTSTLLMAGESYASYLWSEGSSGSSLEVGAEGDYGLTVTDDFGCMGNATVTVAEYITSDPVISGDLYFCPGDSSILIAASGFVAYLWPDSSTGQLFVANSGGTYAVTATDVNACITDAAIAVMEYAVSPPVIVGDDAICIGGNGAIDAGEGYIGYFWSEGSDTKVINVFSPGEYTVTATDVNGCKSSASYTIGEYPLPEVIIGGSTSICVGGSTTLSPGAQFVNYLWSDGSENESLVVNQAGAYSVTVTDVNGCMDSTSVVIEEGAEINPLITGNLDFCPGESTLLDAGGDFATYLWSDSSNTQTIFASSQGTYSVTVTDAGGCVGSAQVDVIEYGTPDPVISGDTSFCEGSSVMLEVDDEFDTYNWSNGTALPELIVDSEGTYTLMVIDSNGCEASVSVFIEELAVPEISLEGMPYFCEGSVTTISVASTFSTYLWSTGNTTNTLITGQAGLFAVTVTNSAGCNAISSIEIERIKLPEADAGIDMALDCNHPIVSLGGDDLSMGSNFIYNWTGPGVDANNSLLPFPEVAVAGIYNLIVIDTIFNCQSEMGSVSIADNTDDPVVVLQVLDVLDCTTSSVVIDGSGSASGSNIVYQWYEANGNLIPDANEATYETDIPDLFFLLVTDTINGCSAMDSVLVEEDLSYPNASAGLSQYLNCDVETATLDGSGSDSGPNLIYIWSSQEGNIISGVNASVATVNQAGWYVLRVLDTVNGCLNIDSVLVAQDTLRPIANAGLDQELDCNTHEVRLNGSASSAGPGINYEWTLDADPSFINSSNTITVVQTGIYTLLVANQGNGCSASDIVIVTEDEHYPSDMLLMVENPTCFRDNDGSIVVEQVVGGTAPFLFSIEGEPFSNVNIFPKLAGGEYKLSVQDALGCEYTTTVFVEQGNDLILDLGEDIHINLGETAIVEAQLNIPGSDISSVSWQGIDSLSCLACTEIEVRPFLTTTYSATVADKNGCIAFDRLTVFVNQPEEVFIPNAFSPNNDGVNDVLMIFAGNDVAKIKSFLVFDRWGETVYEWHNFAPNDPKFGWNGEFNSKKFSTAVFVYMAEVEFIDGNTKVFKGDVVLMK